MSRSGYLLGFVLVYGLFLALSVFATTRDIFCTENGKPFNEAELVLHANLGEKDLGSAIQRLTVSLGKGDASKKRLFVLPRENVAQWFLDEKSAFLLALDFRGQEQFPYKAIEFKATRGEDGVLGGSVIFRYELKKSGALKNVIVNVICVVDDAA